MGSHVPDPQRIFAEHDPDLEPYASMTRDEVWALMQEPEIDSERRAKLEQFLLDKMSTKELEIHRHGQRIACFLMDEYGTFGNAQALFLAELGGQLAVLISQDMPARGEPQECN